MLKALFQITKDDKSRGNPQYGNVYAVLKDGSHSSRAIFEGVERTKIEPLFDEIIDYRLGDFHCSKSRWPVTAEIVKGPMRIVDETEEWVLTETHNVL